MTKSVEVMLKLVLFRKSFTNHNFLTVIICWRREEQISLSLIIQQVFPSCNFFNCNKCHYYTSPLYYFHLFAPLLYVPIIQLKYYNVHLNWKLFPLSKLHKIEPCTSYMEATTAGWVDQLWTKEICSSHPQPLLGGLARYSVHSTATAL